MLTTKQITIIFIIALLTSSSLVSAITTNENIQNNILENNYFDLLIITDASYSKLLSTLVNHKNSVGINSTLVTTNEIYEGIYFTVEGRDEPEKIKYFIKNAIENWQIKYVLLVGSFNKIPIRYSYLESDNDTIPAEPGVYAPENRFISDLYYADIYFENGSFCSWDSNNNNIFGEWSRDDTVKDLVDLKPDVYLGRLACKNWFEAKIVVSKIISYEKNQINPEWFNNMIVVGGDSFNDLPYGTDFNEGEEITEQALEYMSDFNHIRFWFSNENLSMSKLWLLNLISTFNKGAGFVYFSGHCNPGVWTTHPDDEFENWIPFFKNSHISLLFNRQKLPILITECCHPCQFNVTLFSGYLRPLYGKTFYECWPWHMVRKIGGGAIAAIGGTGFSITGIGDMNENEIPDCIEIYDGWFNTHLFKIYAEEEITILGELFGKTINDYVDSFPVYENRYHSKVVEMKVLLGDPSLKIGGYS